MKLMDKERKSCRVCIMVKVCRVILQLKGTSGAQVNLVAEGKVSGRYLIYMRQGLCSKVNY